MAMVLLMSCKEKEPYAVPTIYTLDVKDITTNSAKCGVYITDNGGGDVITSGLIWSTNPNPYFDLTDVYYSIDGSGSGIFTSNMTDLSRNTNYFVKAYARNRRGTSFGKEQQFRTMGDIPRLTTTPVTNITAKTAVSGGSITDNGGSQIVNCGVVWGTQENPSLGSYRGYTNNAPGTGSFTSYLSNLGPGIIYYVRAYANNAAGVGYGQQVSFTSLATAIPPVLVTTSVSLITNLGAISGGNISNDDGEKVIARGVCWNTSSSPTIDLSNKTIDGSGTGPFTSSISGLAANTTYFVRAYATSSAGTGYGQEVSFNTLLTPAIPVLNTSSASSIANTSAISGGSITSDGGESITARGVCWSTGAGPTITLSTKTTDGDGNGSFTSSLTGLVPNTLYYIRAYATNSTGTAYGNEVDFWTTSGGQTITATDIDGNVYSAVTIGNQIWMAENLKTTKFRDGTDIPFVWYNSEWDGLTSVAYCWYGNNVNNIYYKTSYGALYNFYAVADSRKLCPAGWHVATNNEWTSMVDYLGGRNVAGGKLKETGTINWISPNTGATNETGFTALPGGGRDVQGCFAMGGIGYWWTGSEYDNGASFWSIQKGASNIYWSATTTKSAGFSVRCLRD
jgi:uncharacterized protein (TIGR02145 family)